MNDCGISQTERTESWAFPDDPTVQEIMCDSFLPPHGTLWPGPSRLLS